MRYNKRNRAALDDLAPNTRAAAYKWYQYCLDNNIEILITETIRTRQKQAEYVARGSSRTMRSWHLVGQALDFVPITSTGGTDYNAYYRPDIQKAIVEAKRLGFEWGGDWKGGWDKPHLEYQYKGYGTDKKSEVREEDEPMTAEEKKQFEALQKTVEAQAKEIRTLKDKASMDIPSWAKDAVKSAHAAGLIDTMEGGSYEFYRLLTVLHRGGLLIMRGDK